LPCNAYAPAYMNRLETQRPLNLAGGFAGRSDRMFDSGPKAAFRRCPCHVRLYPNSGAIADIPALPSCSPKTRRGGSRRISQSCRMSAKGQKLPRRGQLGMSALPSKAAAALADRRVRYGPKADSCSAANQQRVLFDHLVGGDEKMSIRQGSWHSFGRSVTSAILWG
jgi:hypothetical protein